MKRRELLMAAASAPLAAAAVSQAAPERDKRQYLEIRRYSLFTGASRQRFMSSRGVSSGKRFVRLRPFGFSGSGTH